MSSRGQNVLALVELAAAGAVFLYLWWVWTPSSTDRKLVRASSPRRLVRRCRAAWGRGMLWWASWPHLIDRLGGVRRAPVDPTPSDEIWRAGPATLRRYRGSRTRPVPILIVHALVTQPWILDLAPGRSLIEALVERGFDVFLLDWGDAGAAESRRGFVEYIHTVRRAEESVRAVAGAERLDLAGYCSSATLCLIRLAGWAHDHIASFVGIAPPVDLAVPSRMASMMTSRYLKPVLLLDEAGCVPAAYIRESFHALRPQALRTVTRAFRRRSDPMFRSTYFPLARWAYEQRRIPGALFFDLVQLYRSNALYEGAPFELDGAPIDLRSVRTPVLVALATRDHIVPGTSSHALASVLPQAEVLVCPSGHVSMLSGTGAHEVLWPGLTRFLERTDAASRPTASARRPRAAKPRRKAAGRKPA
jgi:poly[(R)-3-hydroxyalkanoate] polymerase subunit PhaC